MVTCQAKAKGGAGKKLPFDDALAASILNKLVAVKADKGSVKQYGPKQIQGKRVKFFNKNGKLTGYYDVDVDVDGAGTLVFCVVDQRDGSEARILVVPKTEKGDAILRKEIHDRSLIPQSTRFVGSHVVRQIAQDVQEQYWTWRTVEEIEILVIEVIESGLDARFAAGQPQQQQQQTGVQPPVRTDQHDSARPRSEFDDIKAVLEKAATITSQHNDRFGQLGDHIGQHSEQIGQLGKHVSSLTTVTKTHGKQLKDHGTALESHGATLESHGTALESHSATLKDYGERLNGTATKTDISLIHERLDALTPCKRDRFDGASRHLVPASAGKLVPPTPILNDAKAAPSLANPSTPLPRQNLVSPHPSTTQKKMAKREQSKLKKSVQKYSKGSDYYNVPLRTGPYPPGAMQDKDQLLRALDTCPVYRGKVYRAVELDERTLAEWKNMADYEENGFMSTSEVPIEKQPELFKEHRYFNMNCRLTIHSKTGRSIKHLVRDSFKSEQEVLFPPKTPFAVLSYKEEGGKHLFELEELEKKVG